MEPSTTGRLFEEPLGTPYTENIELPNPAHHRCEPAAVPRPGGLPSTGRIAVRDRSPTIRPSR